MHHLSKGKKKGQESWENAIAFVPEFPVERFEVLVLETGYMPGDGVLTRWLFVCRSLIGGLLLGLPPM
jgi:hypothetical protein